MTEGAETWAPGVQVGLDTKAILEAWTAIQKKHPELPVFIVTSDAGTSSSVCHVNSGHTRLLSHLAHLNMLLPYLPNSCLPLQTAVLWMLFMHATIRRAEVKHSRQSSLCPPGKGKALAWAGVPSSLCKQLSAGDWVKGPLAALGGKGGGKPTNAAGQGPNINQIPEALRAADEFAQSKLS